MVTKKMFLSGLPSTDSGDGGGGSNVKILFLSLFHR